MKFSEFVAWYPNSPSEDRVSMTLLRTIEKGRWHRVYYNPPHGSWKELSLLHAGYEYRQVGPKRGLARMKRPDIVFQDIDTPDTSPRFLLCEDKRRREDWDPKLPSLLKAYFEHPNEGVGRLPFDHRRKLPDGLWEPISEDSVYRKWLEDVAPEYIFCFAYGAIRGDFNEVLERFWIRNALKSLTVQIPPIMMVAIGFRRSDLTPLFAVDYSETFPEDVRNRMDVLFADNSD